MNGVILFAGLVFFLWIARSILIPLLIAAFLWYLMNAISDYYRRVFPCRNPTTKRQKICSFTFSAIADISALATVVFAIVLFITQIQPMFSELIAALPAIQEKLTSIGKYASESFGIKFDTSMIPNITKIATNIGASVAGIVTSMGMVLIYPFFILAFHVFFVMYTSNSNILFNFTLSLTVIKISANVKIVGTRSTVYTQPLIDCSRSFRSHSLSSRIF